MNPSMVNLQILNAVALVTLNSSQNRNALSPNLKQQLSEVVKKISFDESIRAVVLTGAHGVFSAGGDLRSIAQNRGFDGKQWREYIHQSYHWLRALAQLEKPLIAAVDGPAFGAGFSLALTSDIILVSPNARFCMSFMKLGLVPDCGATYLLPRFVGFQRARELMLSAREINAEEAVTLNVALQVVPADQLLQSALAMASTFTNASPLSVSLLKRLTEDAGQFERALDAEANAQSLAFLSSDHQRSLDKFLNKEPLDFSWPDRGQFYGLPNEQV